MKEAITFRFDEERVARSVARHCRISGLTVRRAGNDVTVFAPFAEVNGAVKGWMLKHGRVPRMIIIDWK